MIKSGILRFLGIALVLLLLAAFLAIPAHAVTGLEEIEVTPTTGKIGIDVNVSGYGFNAGASIYIYFSSERAYESDKIDDDVSAYERVKTISADDDGEIDIYFTVPDELTDGDTTEKVHSGKYYIYATSTAKTILALGTFTVIGGGVTLDPDDGAVGSEIKVTGEGFGNRVSITVEYDDTRVEIASGSSRTDSAGKFSCTIVIPASIADEHTITVIDADGTESSAEFFVEPQMTISPTSGATGTAVTVDGTGFGDRSDVSVYLKATSMVTGKTDRYGSFKATFNVPEMAPGSYEVKAEDKAYNTATIRFTIIAGASFSQTSGYVNDKVTVSGTGFKANTSLTITFDNTPVGGTVQSNDKGSFSGTFNVPALGAGTYKVKVTDGVNTQETNFTISTSVTISPVTSAASPGNVGTEVTASGIGFVAGKTVTMKFDDKDVGTPPTVKPDGTFSATFKAPASKHGDHTVTVTDGVFTKQFPFVMESKAPAVPSPLKPEMGVKAEAQTVFDWGEITDPSGVTYNLQIATDKEFNSLVLDEKGLTSSQYTLTATEKLKSVSKKAPYYWRVKAIDGASNESEWSGVGSFYTGFTFSMPQWVGYALYGIGALLFGIFCFWLGRRSSYSI